MASPKSARLANRSRGDEHQNRELPGGHRGFNDTTTSFRRQQLAACRPAYYEPGYRRDVSAITRLPEWAVARLLEQLANGAPLRETVREYAELIPLIGFLADNAGKQFPERLRAIEGGAP